jgi:hypothetical protein
VGAKLLKFRCCLPCVSTYLCSVTFEEYLVSKKIEAPAFKQQQPAEYEVWQNEFVQLHPNSFTAQKLFLINKIRRTFPLKEVEASPSSPVSAPVAKPKPIMRPKMN